jgi:hypothetical protein
MHHDLEKHAPLSNASLKIHTLRYPITYSKKHSRDTVYRDKVDCFMYPRDTTYRDKVDLMYTKFGNCNARF